MGTLNSKLRTHPIRRNNASTTAAAVDNGSTDNCAVNGLTLSQTTFTCSNAGANTVFLTVTDVMGNFSTCSAVVTVLGQAITATATTDTTACGFNVSCANGTDGIATANGFGGCPGYTYLWSNGATSSIASGLGAGTYTVTVTDFAGTTSVANVTLTAAPAIVTTATSTLSCPNGTEGSIDLSVSGGSTCLGGFTYLWDNGGRPWMGQ